LYGLTAVEGMLFQKSVCLQWWTISIYLSSQWCSENALPFYSSLFCLSCLGFYNYRRSKQRMYFVKEQ
jgi:hypothetical protein